MCVVRMHFSPSFASPAQSEPLRCFHTGTVPHLQAAGLTERVTAVLAAGADPNDPRGWRERCLDKRILFIHVAIIHV
jgi:hypothetical protein